MTKYCGRVNVQYVLGLLETEGCFQISFDPNWNMKCEIKISQKVNTNALREVQQFFESHGISSTITAPTLSRRGYRSPDLKVVGNNNVKTLLNLLKSASPNEIAPLTGVKARDYLILWASYENPGMTPLAKVGLKKSLHKTNLSDPDLTGNNELSRTEYEERILGVGNSQNQSVTESLPLLMAIDAEYVSHQNRLRQQLSQNTYKLSPAYVVGIIDGDGGSTVGLRDRQTYLEWDIQISFSLEVGSRLTLEILKWAVGYEPDITKVPSRLDRTNITSLRINIRAGNNIARLQSILQEFPIIGDLRAQQFALVMEYQRLSTSGMLSSYEQICAFIDQMYAVSAQITSGKPRKNINDLKASVARILNWRG